jgi:hypothetical protein
MKWSNLTFDKSWWYLPGGAVNPGTGRRFPK